LLVERGIVDAPDGAEQSLLDAAAAAHWAAQREPEPIASPTRHADAGVEA
jgi:hypothetical protein